MKKPPKPPEVIDLGRVRRVRGILGELRADLAGDPDLRERTGAMLRGELATRELEDPVQQDAQISMRIPKALIDRAEALVPVVNAKPEYGAVRISRSTVLRLAMMRGIEALEAEAQVAGPKKRAKRLPRVIGRTRKKPR